MTAPLPQCGGTWVTGPGLLQRGGYSWPEVRLPVRLRSCTPQSAPLWNERVAQGNRMHGIQWCACCVMGLPYGDGRWTARNLRRLFGVEELPGWYRDLVEPVHQAGCRADTENELVAVQHDPATWAVGQRFALTERVAS